MIGPGRYDKEADKLLKETQAQGIILLIINGNRGEGFSATFAREWADQHAAKLPAYLRALAHHLENDLRASHMN
jgi:hypothetical protein